LCHVTPLFAREKNWRENEALGGVFFTGNVEGGERESEEGRGRRRRRA